MKTHGSMWRHALRAAIVFLTVAGAPATQARTTFPAHGGSGDISNASVCPTGNFIVGFRGRAGLWIDQIRIRCAPLLDGGGVGKSTALAGAGGPGGGEQAQKCDPGHVINQINFFTTKENRQIEMISFRCMNPDDRSMQGGYVHFGYDGGVTFRNYEQVCPDGEAAVGLTHRWGEHVNAIALICDVLRRP